MGKVRKGKGKENKNQKITIKIVCNSAAFAVGAGVLWKLSDNSTFETALSRDLGKDRENIRAVVLADLHNNVFGQDNERLC